MFGRLFDNPMAVVILVLIIVVVFGWKKLPDAARSLGRSTRILKSELDDMNGNSKASQETVPGETSQPRAAGPVPGESAPPPPPAQNPAADQAPPTADPAQAPDASAQPGQPPRGPQAG